VAGIFTAPFEETYGSKDLVHGTPHFGLGAPPMDTPGGQLMSVVRQSSEDSAGEDILFTPTPVGTMEIAAMINGLVSVIIPCFRQGHLLSQAIDSIMNQSYILNEIIVVNDGSDDSTDAVAKGYGDRIHYVRKTNGGLSSARNTGIQVAHGSYLLFLDADDMLHPQALEWLTHAMDGREDRLCVMGFKNFEMSPEWEQGKCSFPPPLPCLPLLIHENIAPPHCYLCSASMVKRIGGFATLRSCGVEDWDLWLRLALEGVELKVVPKIGAYYRRYEGSMSTNSVRMLESRVDVLLRLNHRVLMDQDLLHQWGQEILVSNYRVRRRCIAQQLDPRYVNEISHSIRLLEKSGTRKNTQRGKRLRDFIINLIGDYIFIDILRITNHPIYEYYLNGIH
jgi:glycosyltransferase involved in cell wall biosynthesis